MLNDSPFAPASALLRRVLCLAAVLALLLLSGCKTEIYQGLSENQANTMLSVLLRHGIPAEKIAAKAGYSIAVQENRIIQALEVLKENSLPREDFQNLGKVFAAEGMISSATEEQARLAFAISQELSDTFSRIDGVLTARVHVVLSQTDLSTGNVTPPSAAVFLRHTPESQATRLIPHIRELTANAVPGLLQDKVSVMLVPVRETVSVPMPPQENVRQDDSRLYAFAVVGILLALAVGGFGTAAFMHLRRRSGEDKSEDE
ncbi:type III secretion system inner membrane ring lipoprotein SctJ [Mailhella sp.]|uniref:type III secretion system inner membrane ring lipoprotein SctJ n=1 Tax=Mailhella sp. TaxID=1981029 RepID=UPI004063F43C